MHDYLNCTLITWLNDTWSFLVLSNYTWLSLAWSNDSWIIFNCSLIVWWMILDHWSMILRLIDDTWSSLTWKINIWSSLTWCDNIWSYLAWLEDILSHLMVVILCCNLSLGKFKKVPKIYNFSFIYVWLRTFHTKFAKYIYIYIYIWKQNIINCNKNW